MSDTDRISPEEKSNKEIIFKILKALKIKKVEVSYSGCGDSGQIDYIEFFKSGSKPVDINKLTNGLIISGIKTSSGWVTPSPNNWFTRNYVDKPPTSDIKEVINELCYDLLETYHGGWEINSGSDGQFVFNVPEGKISWSHSEIVEERDTTDREI